jgi:hypothetical protein
VRSVNKDQPVISGRAEKGLPHNAVSRPEVHYSLPALRAQVIPVKFLYQHEHPVPERELEAGDIPVVAGERGIGPLRLKFMFHAVL